MEDFFDLDIVDQALKVNLCHKINVLMNAREKSKATKIDFINSIQAQNVVETSQMHIKYISFALLKEKMKMVKCANNLANLRNICNLYGLVLLKANCHACFECGYFSSQIPYSDMILEGIHELNQRLRPVLLSIIESMPISDEMLVSAVGNSYGDIYETHLEWAKESRLNKTKLGDAIPDGFMELMMPILKGKM